jgi:uncharacterized protein YgbK (DUF1537 family)
MENIVIIADDLTGAADTAVQFCPCFEDTTLVSYQHQGLVFEPAYPAVKRATAIYTNSRALGVEQARKRLVGVAQRLRDINELELYKKIDSCMRGNVGAECDALLERLDFEAGFITPAFPEMGRTTLESIHRVHRVPLAESEISRDPVTPVTESSLIRIVAKQSRLPVAHVGLDRLEGSLDRLIDDIEGRLGRGVRHVVFDATQRAHLDRIAELKFAMEHRILPVGSAGLAGSIANRLTSKPLSAKPPKGVASEGFNLLVCGTTSAVTGTQIDYLLKRYAYERIQLNPVILGDLRRNDEFLEAVSAARSGLAKKHVILTIVSQPGTRNHRRQPDVHPAADSIARGLGQFVAKVAAHTKPGHIFLTGGDTADAVLTALGVEGIRILGEVVAGVVQGVIIGGMLECLPVVTKAGAFGQKDTLVAVHESWEGMAEGSKVQGSEVQG